MTTTEPTLVKELKTIEHVYEGTPFYIKATEKESQPGCWNVWLVEIFHQDGQCHHKIGEYTRGYSGYVTRTFYPFQHKGKWYALYSASYTKTSIARLQDDQGKFKFQEWCDGAGGNGFCPTEFYVPKGKYSLSKWISKDWKNSTKDKLAVELSDMVCVTWDNEKSYPTEPIDVLTDPLELTPENIHKHYVVEAGIRYPDFGFLCGCHWGDDSSWKIRYIDFSDLENKNVKIEERFGYFELPSRMSLKDSIVLSESSIDGKHIGLMQVVNFNGDKREKSDYELNQEEAAKEDKEE